MEITVDKFKRARGALGLNQQEFARMVGKTRQTISEYENGQRDIAIETYLLALAWAGNDDAFNARKKDVGLPIAE